jgi:hypothetical protein
VVVASYPPCVNSSLLGLAASGALILATVALPAPADAATRTCAGRKVTIVGTPGNDHINGTRKADVIDGLAGSDVINGLQGNDTICGNYGADDLRGNGGNDRLYGGKDAYNVLAPDSTVRHGDTLRGGAGDDVLVPGFDYRTGTTPEGDADVDDLIDFESAPGPVTLSLVTQRATGDGRDRVVVNGSVRLFLTRWDDSVASSDYNTEFRLFGGDDTVSDGYGSDILDGGPGTDDNLASTGGDDQCISIEVGQQNC